MSACLSPSLNWRYNEPDMVEKDNEQLADLAGKLLDLWQDQASAMMSDPRSAVFFFQWMSAMMDAHQSGVSSTDTKRQDASLTDKGTGQWQEKKTQKEGQTPNIDRRGWDPSVFRQGFGYNEFLKACKAWNAFAGKDVAIPGGASAQGLADASGPATATDASISGNDNLDDITTRLDCLERRLDRMERSKKSRRPAPTTASVPGVGRGGKSQG